MLTGLDPLELRQHPRDRFLQVQRAQVVPVNAVRAQRPHHLDGQVDTIVLDRGVIVLNRFEVARDLGRDARFAQVGHSTERLIILNGHDAG
jgi:hypothetical protein